MNVHDWLANLPFSDPESNCRVVEISFNNGSRKDYFKNTTLHYYEKGEIHRCIEPYFIAFQWTAWYVFGFCLERQDWRLFKLARMWELKQCDESFTPREIPLEKRDFNAQFTDQLRLTALFDPSTKYQLIETYGLHCFTKTDCGKLHLEIGYTNREYIMNWLLGFGDKVKVLEPADMAEEICQIAKNIVASYE